MNAEQKTIGDVFANPQPLLRMIAFAEKLRGLTIVLSDGSQIPLRFSEESGNAVFDLRNLTATGQVVPALPVGPDGSVLVADAAATGGVRWI